MLEQGSTSLRAKGGCQVVQATVMGNWKTISYHSEGQITYHTNVLADQGGWRFVHYILSVKQALELIP